MLKQVTTAPPHVAVRTGTPGSRGVYRRQTPLISVVVPAKTITPHLETTRQQLAQSAFATPLELILVIDPDKIEALRPLRPHETVVAAALQGRGFACVQGAALAQGEVVLFLHADTTLPTNWDIAIRHALEDASVVGGGFSLAFDDSAPYFKFLALLSRLWFHVKGELWGDRALFVRRDLLVGCLPLMDVPIMEDILLSKCMRANGKLRVLPERVTTSAATFNRRGWLGHLWRIAKCRTLYALGQNAHQIWACYYG